jgi:hypothetical protein
MPAHTNEDLGKAIWTAAELEYLNADETQRGRIGQVARLFVETDLDDLPHLSMADVCDAAMHVVRGLPSSSAFAIPNVELFSSAAMSVSRIEARDPEFSVMAARFQSRLLDSVVRTTPTFSSYVAMLCDARDPETRAIRPIASSKLAETLLKFGIDRVDAMVQKYDPLSRLLTFDRMSILLRSYLLSVDSVPIETLGFMHARVALTCMSGETFEELEAFFADLRHNRVQMASPILFSAGLRDGCMTSCYLLSVERDCMPQILKSMVRCGMLSKGGGGIGLTVSSIRGKRTRISRTLGKSKGPMGFLKLLEKEARYVDQGGRRKGAFSVQIDLSFTTSEEIIQLNHFKHGFSHAFLHLVSRLRRLAT